jgi:BirA family biotin operon repressor/biotin-[acetyl-CoA-carboxylase] ligase
MPCLCTPGYLCATLGACNWSLALLANDCVYGAIKDVELHERLLQCKPCKCYGRIDVSLEKVLTDLASGQQRSCGELGIDRDQLSFIHDRIIGLQIACERKGDTLCIPGGLDLLSAEKISELVTTRARESLSSVRVFMEIDSTNSYLLEQKLTDPRGMLVLAERQSAGRGRRGRSWISPFGTNLYMSLLWRMPLAQTSIEGLSLAVGLAVIQGLEAENFPGITMKWPNDLLLQDAKVAGILIELKPPQSDFVELVIGVGINLQMPQASGQLIDQPWRDLSAQMQGKNRNSIAASIISSLITALEKFASTGFAGFRQDWQDKDAFFNRPVELHMGEATITGIAKGVNEQGAVCLLVDDEIREFHGGEMTLRAIDDS